MKRICSEGTVTGRSFGSPEKRYGTSRKNVVTDDFDRTAIRRMVHELYTCKGYLQSSGRSSADINSQNFAASSSTERTLCRRKDKFEAASKGDGV